ncbi:hypothetical protein EVAR_22891_1 [Eumeta japonica]|uniref:Endonuclease/exonuclease/phosphatase domain-containing protein n=1 Tax=Eumeta variegata TaxID=151549 RepID=A0A4C1UU45_EUMVA|nr:hypothetical protein EVAR_22891_1 [Eumeta japonica]
MSKPFEEREKFWTDVRNVLVKCDRNEKFVLLGDFNSWVDVQRDGYEKVLEMLRGGGRIVARLLFQLFNKCCKSRKVPYDWCKSVIVLPYKRIARPIGGLNRFHAHPPPKVTVVHVPGGRGARCGSDSGRGAPLMTYFQIPWGRDASTNALPVAPAPPAPRRGRGPFDDNVVIEARTARAADTRPYCCLRAESAGGGRGGRGRGLQPGAAPQFRDPPPKC